MNHQNSFSSDNQLLWSGFYRSSQRFPNRPALEVDGSVFSYQRLLDKSLSLAATLAKHSPSNDPPLTAIFAYRSATAFAGILAALFRSHGYVPLNRTVPPDRSRTMLERAGCSAVIVDSESAAQLDTVLAGAKKPLVIILPDISDVSALAARYPQHTVIGKESLESPRGWTPRIVSPDELAYVLFTSGSTGIPKGVMVSHRNVRHYVEWTVKRYNMVETDRCSQCYDLTFDPSVHDMFVTWEVGACLCCPTQKQMINPGTFIRESRLTIWSSVPSTATFMRRLGMLKPDMYPQIRLSIFCGEALQDETVKSWALAAPNSIIENLYGPTELTVTCIVYRWDPERSPAECEHGGVPIGEPFDGMTCLIVDDRLQPVPIGTPGELLMAGPQMALGYWKDPEKTAAAFVALPGSPVKYYRTGDRVRRAGPGKPILYLGRIDNQIKILGHRVELGEIEAVLRQESGIDTVVAVGWPVDSVGARAIEAFVQASQIDDQRVIEKIRGKLPAYMVPKRIHSVPTFPLNVNGKIDRKALISTLAQA